MDIDKKDVGKRIKMIRSSLGETAEVFGERFDPKANRGLVSGWENGRYLPNPERLKVIAELGNVSVNELLYGPLKEYINNVLWSAPALELDSQIIEAYYQRLIKRPPNIGKLYMDSEALIIDYLSFQKMYKENERNENIVPLGANIHRAQEICKDNDYKGQYNSINLFLMEATNYYESMFGITIEEAREKFDNIAKK